MQEILKRVSGPKDSGYSVPSVAVLLGQRPIHFIVTFTSNEYVNSLVKPITWFVSPSADLTH